MIDIKNAIEQSKKMENVSAGGSQCFDFIDVVLVKYIVSLKYVEEYKHRARSCEEDVMEGVAPKIKNGVNTPRHLAIARVIEGKNTFAMSYKKKVKVRIVFLWANIIYYMTKQLMKMIHKKSLRL